MNELIESGDPRAKVVGKRRQPSAGSAASLAQFDQLQRSISRLMNGLPYPKGVHRFKTEEEFEQWRMEMMIKNSPARRASRTSLKSVEG